jgi:4-hydroxy-3-methylbut-2-enyl diphosphate reductase
MEPTAANTNTTPAQPVKLRRVNLRTPEIMEAVKAKVEKDYKSTVVDYMRLSGKDSLSAKGLTIKLAKAFGFCYGVERAIDLAYAAARYFTDKKIFLLGEIIHNPDVNEQIRSMGITSIPMQKDGTFILDEVTSEDVVIVPAFGTDTTTMSKIEAIGALTVDTTCGDVMSVWKRVKQYSKEQVTSVIHGKASHEETLATSSRALNEDKNSHFLVVYNLKETDYVCNYIRNGGNKEEFLAKFKGAYSDGFDPDLHLKKIGVANQTTMLRGETEEVQRRFKQAIADRYGEEKKEEHFRFFDTICGATQERQDALTNMLSKEKMDLLLVVGGYNSSNTSHLAEMGEAVLPTYFVKNVTKLLSEKLISHYNQHKKVEEQTDNWIPEKENLVIGITAGASCPNNLIEEIIHRLFEYKGVNVLEIVPKEA